MMNPGVLEGAFCNGTFTSVPPSVDTFSSNAGAPDTVPAVVTEEPLAGIVTVKSLVIGGAPGTSGFDASFLRLITTFPLGSLDTCAVGKPSV